MSTGGPVVLEATCLASAAATRRRRRSSRPARPFVNAPRRTGRREGALPRRMRRPGAVLAHEGVGKDEEFPHHGRHGRGVALRAGPAIPVRLPVVGQQRAVILPGRPDPEVVFAGEKGAGAVARGKLRRGKLGRGVAPHSCSRRVRSATSPSRCRTSVRARRRRIRRSQKHSRRVVGGVRHRGERRHEAAVVERVAPGSSHGDQNEALAASRSHAVPEPVGIADPGHRADRLSGQ